MSCYSQPSHCSLLLKIRNSGVFIQSFLAELSSCFVVVEMFQRNGFFAKYFPGGKYPPGSFKKRLDLKLGPIIIASGYLGPDLVKHLGQKLDASMDFWTDLGGQFSGEIRACFLKMY